MRRDSINDVLPSLPVGWSSALPFVGQAVSGHVDLYGIGNIRHAQFFPGRMDMQSLWIARSTPMNEAFEERRFDWQKTLMPIFGKRPSFIARPLRQEKVKAGGALLQRIRLGAFMPAFGKQPSPLHMHGQRIAHISVEQGRRRLGIGCGNVILRLNRCAVSEPIGIIAIQHVIDDQRDQLRIVMRKGHARFRVLPVPGEVPALL